MHLIMLEDERDRIERFHRVLELNVKEHQLFVFRTAPSFVTAFCQLIEPPALVCLDHDLFTDTPEDPDPGDGRDVTSYLSTVQPSGPVLIHSSNNCAADVMLYTLLDAGWTAERISPLGQDWIESYWYPTAMRMIGQIS